MSSKPTLARTLKLQSIDDILFDAKRIASDAAAHGRGRWTPAQNIWHVAKILEFSVDGFPFTAPLFFRLVGPLMKGRFLKNTFSPGISAPQRIAAHTEPGSDVTIGQAMQLLEEAVASQKSKGFIAASPLLGPLSAEQWVQLHCRHAELHFGLIELAAGQQTALSSTEAQPV